MKIKRQDDKTRTSIDKYNYYTDSSFNEASPSYNNILNNNLQDNITFGGITVPLEKGCMYADTPECTIFITKRQWYEQEYAYFSGSNDLERNGKKRELLIRLAIGNIIRKKLDYINNYEIVTKYNSFFKNINDNQDKLSGSLLTRYYTENFTLNEELNDINTIKDEEYITIINKIKIKENKKVVPLYSRKSTSSDKLFPLEFNVDIITSGIGSIDNPDNVFDVNINKNSKYYNKYNNIDKKWIKIDLLQLSLMDDFYKIINQQIDEKYIAGDNIYDILLNIQKQTDKYGRKIDRYAYINFEEYRELIEIIDKEKYYLAYRDKQDKNLDIFKKQYKNVFNGVIELCNVSNLSASNSNKSYVESAEFTVYNPNNILVITEEDIDIALSEHPFLDVVTDLNGKKIDIIYEINPFTGEKEQFYNFRGRYYTKHVYNIVVSNYINTIYKTNINEITLLKNTLQDDLEKIKNILIEVNTGNINQSKYDDILNIEYKSIGRYIPKIKTKIYKSDFDNINILKTKLNKRIREIEDTIIDLSQYYLIENNNNNNIGKIDDKEKKYIKYILKKLYQNKTIFEIYDKVNIFLTSPSRTIRIDEDFQILSEDPTIYKDIIDYIKEINSIIHSLYFYIKYDYNQYIGKINQQLLTGNIPQAKKIIDIITGNIKKDNVLNSIIKSAKDKIDEFANYYNSYIKNKNSQIFNIKNIQLNIDINNPLDIIQKLDDTYIGLVDNQYQVFEGVIKNIRRDFRNGVYTINIMCADNLDYLDRSQYTQEPNLLTPSGAIKYSFLDDPIWRSKDRQIIKNLDKNIIDDLVGRWKTGILTLTANYTTKKDVTDIEKDINPNKTLDTDLFTLDDLNRMIGMIPTVLNEPFGGADPANIISVLVTGIPFNVNTYLLNTIFGGSVSITPYKNGKYYFGDVIDFGPFEMIRRQILEQIRKFGNFEPFLSITNLTIKKEDIIESNYNTSINIANAIIYFIKNYINTHNDVFTKLIDNIKTKENNKNSIWFNINKNNVKEVIVINDKFPNSTSDISLNKSFEEYIGKELTFFIYALIKGSVDYNQIVNKRYIIDKINNVLTKGFNLDDLSLIYKMDNYGNIEKEPYKYKILPTDEQFIYYLQDKVREKIDKGRLYNKILDYYNNYDISNIKPGEYYPDKTIIDQKIKERDIYQPNKLIATKQSIINKTKRNFLVISDKYLLNDDLIDYCKEIKSSPGDLRPAQFATVLTRCVKAAKKIDFEFYADTQGNIIFKPPTYNRTLQNHLFNIDNIDILFKKEIIDLLKKEGVYDVVLKKPILDKYRNIVKDLKKKIHNNIKESIFIINNTIVLYNNIKNKYNNNYLISLVYDKYKEIDDIINISKLEVDFINFNNKYTINIDLNNINDNYKYYYDILNKFNNYNHNKTLEYINKYSIDSRKAKVKDIQDLNNLLASNIIDNIKNMYQLLKDVSGLLSGIDLEISKIKYDFSSYINELTDYSHIHILDSSIIISESYVEEYPEFTRLNCYSEIPYLNGALTGDRIQQLYASWAGSADFDLMRVYGYKSEDYYCPFITNPKHLSIYAHMLMARQRARILCATITVRGDSKYQVGDCVFIPDENIYYYITKVTHNFSYGDSYETILTLEYGRRVGYFIPYPFDVIGKYSSGFNLIFTDNSPISISDILDAYNKKGE